MKIKLLHKKKQSPDVMTFLFEPETKLDFKAGQFLRYHIQNSNADKRGENRFFSIASAPFENQIQLTTKFTPGSKSTFKKYLKKLKTGDFIEAFGPFGSFTLNDPLKHSVFISFGIGITPFRSILLDLDNRNKPINVTLLYANRSRDAIFNNELNALAKKHPGFKIFYIVSDENTQAERLSENAEIVPEKIDEDIIRRLIPNYQNYIFYTSGPEPIIMAIEEMLKHLGIPKKNIKLDYFPGYKEY